MHFCDCSLHVFLVNYIAWHLSTMKCGVVETARSWLRFDLTGVRRFGLVGGFKCIVLNTY